MCAKERIANGEKGRIRNGIGGKVSVGLGFCSFEVFWVDAGLFHDELGTVPLGKSYPTLDVVLWCCKGVMVRALAGS